MQTAEILKTLEDIADVGIVNYKQTDAVREAIRKRLKDQQEYIKELQDKL